jgi:hypothetical protein
MMMDSGIVVAEGATSDKSFIPFVRKRWVPQPRSGSSLYACIYEADGTRNAPFLIDEKASKNLPNDGKVMFYHVSVTPHPISLPFAKLLKDEDGNEWDCHVNGTLSIIDQCQFLSSYAIHVACPGIPLSAAMVESWIANTVGQLARKSLSGDKHYSRKDLLRQDTVSAKWWRAQFPGWLKAYGIEVQVADASYESADAKMAEAEEAKQRDLERIARTKQLEREAELREAAARMAYEKRKSEIEQFETDRKHQLELLEMRYQKERLEESLKVETARRESEKAVADAERALARDEQSAKRAEDRERDAECRHETVLRELTEMREMLMRLPGDLLAQLASRKPDIAHKAAERLVSPEFDVSPTALASLGYRVDRQSLIRFLHEKEASDGNVITLEKSELVSRTIERPGTRDICTLMTLPVRSALQVTLATSRPGFVTLLNIGTSGTLYVHVPNAYVSVAASCVESGQAYTVPGPQLLPCDRLRQYGLNYVEAGPSGWEHLVAIVSDTPFVSTEWLARARVRSPFITLSPAEISDLCDALAACDPKTWSAGVLSFLVE